MSFIARKGHAATTPVEFLDLRDGVYLHAVRMSATISAISATIWIAFLFLQYHLNAKCISSIDVFFRIIGKARQFRLFGQDYASNFLSGIWKSPLSVRHELRSKSSFVSRGSSWFCLILIKIPSLVSHDASGTSVNMDSVILCAGTGSIFSCEDRWELSVIRVGRPPRAQLTLENDSSRGKIVDRKTDGSCFLWQDRENFWTPR